ncbi:MAG: SIMPL domain-containing protein [Cohnella sp.]|uniref:SIMPL domain-containing protein n=1 Tax=Cohnella sp. TaxID=1883426 RepID=UPI000E3AB31E|nr:SIMPL domain-containing protein [Cohnella sp.]REK62049.1 MAG: SIMPL domain-containing protein [Cohnella sp.]
MKNKGMIIAAALLVTAIGWFGFGRGEAESAKAESPAAQSAGYAPNTVTVEAQGSVKVEPDVAYVNVAVETRGQSAKEAQQANADKFAAVEKTLYETYAIDKKDVQTTNFNVYPEYNYTEKDGQVLKGYVALHQVQITYRKLSEIGKLLDALAASGANRMDGVTFGTEKREQYELDALKKAMANASAKASVLASSGNRQLGGVIHIVQGDAAPIPVAQASTMKEAKMMASDSAASSSVQSGQIEITANVTVQYELK